MAAVLDVPMRAYIPPLCGMAASSREKIPLIEERLCQCGAVDRCAFSERLVRHYYGAGRLCYSLAPAAPNPGVSGMTAMLVGIGTR